MTNKEIAKILQISPAAVSLALNNKPGVSEETRQRILELKEASLLKNIKTISKQTLGSDIGLIIFKEGSGLIADTPFFSELIDSLDRWTNQNAFHFRVNQVSSDNVRDYIDSLNASDMAGLLILATEMSRENAVLFKKFLKKPFVFLDAYFPGLNVDAVLMDNVGGISLAIDYAIKMGHKSIGYLRSAIPCQNFYDRYSRFVSESVFHKELDTSKVIQLTPSIDQACEEMKNILNSKPKLPSIFISGNDRIAIGAIRALQEFGYNIPEDISIIGFDDMPLAQYLNPSLTSIRLRENEIARLAVERLVNKLLNPEDTTFSIQQFMEVEIIIRNSVKRIL